MILLTVGTYPLAFDRLIEAVDRAVGEQEVEDDVFAQIGYCNYRPKHMEFVELLDKDAFDERVSSASALIGHAGMGTITMALDHELPLLAVPRRERLKEVMNDHQVATARKFEELGHILVAYDTRELVPKLKELRAFTPKPRIASPEAVAERVGRFLSSLQR